MKADPGTQRRLVEVQALDTAIAQVENKARTLPIHDTVKAVATERSQIADAVTEATTRASDAREAETRAEKEVTPVRERLVRNQQRIDAGAGDHKALSGLIDEIASLKRRLAELEDAQLEAMDALEQAEARLAEVTGRSKTIDGELQGLVEQRNTELRELAFVAKQKQSQRAALTATIPADLLALYDKIRARYGGTGVGELTGTRCTACGIEATTTDYARYVAAPPDEVVRCVECDRILVRGRGKA